MMTMAIAIFFSVPTIHKIEKLNDRTDQIAKGNYKVEDLNIQSPKELKELSDAFNQMTIRIDNQMNQIKAEQDEKLYMVQNLAHDLKTPLASIKSYSEGLNDGMIYTELAKQDAYQVLINQADRLNQMFDDLTDVMSVNNKRSNTRINIDQLLMPILESYQQCLKKNKRQLEVNIPLNIKAFYQDKIALERIITNFIDNALKFSDTDKVVTITVFEHERNMLGISVKDEGIGIKGVHLRYIFDRTYRVDNSRNKETGGSGLGLYIASTLAKQIGGEISVDSTFGEGTTMTVYFPRN